MRSVLIITILSFFFISCKKNSTGGAPKLSFESVSPTVLNRGQIILFTLSFTDADNNLLGDSALYIEKVVPQCPADTTFKIWQPLPSYTASGNQKVQILISYGYGSGLSSPPIGEPVCNENDTCFFKFALKDQAGHTSDTVSSPTIVIIK
jgi:hypothetical protein